MIKNNPIKHLLKSFDGYEIYNHLLSLKIASCIANKLLMIKNNPVKYLFQS